MIRSGGKVERRTSARTALAVAATALVASVLAGCAGSPGTSQSPSNSQSPTPTASQIAWTLDRAKKVILESYALYESVGVTETSVWNGESSRLIYDPNAGDYQAAYRNDATGQEELIYEAYAFAVFNASLAIEDKNLKFALTKDGFSLTTEEGGTVEYKSDGKYLTAATGSGGGHTWSSTIRYELDPEMQKVLADLTAKLLEE